MNFTAHRRFRWPFQRAILTVSIGALLASTAAPGRAADVTWTNGFATNAWNTVSPNWSTGVWNNANADGAIFSAAGLGTVNVSEPITVRSLSFTAGGYTLNSSIPLTFTSSGASTLAAGTINVSTGTATINAPLNSPIDLTKVGAGTLVLTSAGSTFAGAFNVSGGTVSVTGAGTLPSTAISINSGAQLSTDGGALAAGAAVTLNGSGNLTMTGSETIGSLASASPTSTVTLNTNTLTTGGDNSSTVFAGVVSGTGGLVKQGTGMFTLTGSHAYGGATTISAGTLALGNGGNLSGSGAVTVAGGATLAVGSGTLGLGANIGGSLTLSPGATLNLADGVANILGVQGNLALGSISGAPSLSFDVGGAFLSTDQIGVNGAATIGLSGTIPVTINGVGSTAMPAGPYNLITGGAGSGLNGGSMALTSGKVGIAGQAHPISLTRTATAVTLNLGAAAGLDVAFWRGDQSATWTTNNAGNTNWATSASGSTDTAALPASLTDVFFTAAGAGNLSSTLGAETTINSLNFTSGSGAVTIGGADFLNLSAVGPGQIGLAVNGGTALRTVSAPLNFNTAATVANNGAFGVTTLAVDTLVVPTANTDVILGGTGNTTVNGSIITTGSGGFFVKNDPGTVTLGAASAFARTIVLQAGVLAISNDNQLGNAGNQVILQTGSTLRVTSAVNTSRVITINGSDAAPSGLDLTGGVTQVIGANQLTGSGTARVSITGNTNPGVLSVEGDNSGFDGAIQVGAPGQLVGSILSPRLFTAGNGATLRLQGAGRLSGATSITVNNASALTITQPATAVTGRLGSASLSFRNGRFQYNPSANGGAAINESFGNVSLTGTLTISASATAGPATGTTLNFNSLTRIDHATLGIKATGTSGAGTIGGAVSAGIRYLFSALANVGGSGTTRNVVPWAAAATVAAFPDDLNSLVTYDANGFRPLTGAEVNNVTSQTAFDALSGPGQNVDLQANVSVTGTKTINALTAGSGIPTLTGSGTLVVNSGAIANLNTVTFNGPALNFPSGGFLHLGFPVNVQGSSAITGGGSGGVTVSALNADTDHQLRLTNTVANTFTGGLFINGNAQVTFQRNDQLGRNDAGTLQAGAITLGGGQLLYSPASGTTVSLTDSGTPRTISANASSGTIGTATAGAVLEIPGTISGAGQVQFGGGTNASATGVVHLTNPSANTYTGGTLISTGSLRLQNANQLGTGPVLLNGGTLQANFAANLNFTTPLTVVASSTLLPNLQTITLSGGLNGSGGTSGTAATALVLNVSGSGTVALDGPSNFAGTLAANIGRVLFRGSIQGVTALAATNGGTLELGAADLINDGATVALTAATLATAGFSETLGTLTLGVSGFSVIDLGSGASLLRFAASNAQSWNDTLRITNWSGSTLGGGTDQLFFGSDATGLTAGQLGAITFLNPAGFAPGTYPALLRSTGELVAVPEPASTALLLGGFALLGLRRRRQSAR